MPVLTPRALSFTAMFAAVLIYGGQFPFVRLGLASGLTPYDLGALRFIVAGVVMVPVFVALGVRDCAGLGWTRGIVLFLTGGLPLAVISNAGLQWAPAAHGSAIQPGTVAVTATLLGYLAHGMAVPGRVILGLSVVLSGLGLVALSGVQGETGPYVLLGDALFVGCGLAWGGFTYLCARWKVAPLAGTAVVSILSVACLPAYFAWFSPRLMDLPFGVIAFHGIYQGLLNIVIGLVLWTYGARGLGATTAARFPPLIPVLGTFMAIPVLGEVPSPMTLLGIAAIVVGLLYASSAKRPSD